MMLGEGGFAGLGPAGTYTTRGYVPLLRPRTVTSGRSRVFVEGDTRSFGIPLSSIASSEEEDCFTLRYRFGLTHAHVRHAHARWGSLG